METHRSAQDQHRHAVLALLHTGAQLTRTQIAARLGITRSTVSEVLAGLREEGAVVVVHRAESGGRGRPAEVLSVNSGATRFVSFDFAHTRVLACLANSFGDIIDQRALTYSADVGWEERCRRAVSLAREMEADDPPFPSLSGVAVGLPGPNSAMWDSGLPGIDCAEPFHFVGARIREVMRQAFGVPVLVDHHIRFAVLAEASVGRTRPLQNVLYVRLSVGVGGAVMSSGTVSKGAHHHAGEIGHIIVDRTASARTCRCRRRGCLETVASFRALNEAWETSDARRDSGLSLEEASAQRHPAATAMVAEAAALVGGVIGMTAMATDPAEIILSGEVPSLLDDFETIAQRAVDLEVFSPADVQVRRARLGTEAGAIGGVIALLARQPSDIDLIDGFDLTIPRLNLKGAASVG